MLTLYWIQSYFKIDFSSLKSNKNFLLNQKKIWKHYSKHVELVPDVLIQFNSLFGMALV